MDIRGSSVEDATQDMMLKVTNSDIKGATKKAPSKCAIARACKRQENVEAIIHITRVYLRNGGKNWVRYILPKALRGEIIAFDRGGKFLPGEFVLMAPKNQEKLGSIRRKVRSNKRATLRRKPVYMSGIRISLEVKK
jgi:hypothetical protein